MKSFHNLRLITFYLFCHFHKRRSIFFCLLFIVSCGKSDFNHPLTVQFQFRILFTYFLYHKVIYLCNFIIYYLTELDPCFISSHNDSSIVYINKIVLLNAAGILLCISFYILFVRHLIHEDLLVMIFIRVL